MSGGAASVRIADLPSRADFPADHTTVRGGSRVALDALRTEGIESLVQELAGDRYARSAAASRVYLGYMCCRRLSSG